MAAQASAEPEAPFTTVAANDHIAFGGQPAQTEAQRGLAPGSCAADIPQAPSEAPGACLGAGRQPVPGLPQRDRLCGARVEGRQVQGVGALPRPKERLSNLQAGGG